MVSLAFFALHLRYMPYKSPTLNVVKTVSEIQLFVVLLTSILLQSHNIGFDAEVVTIEDYATIQVIATTMIVPVIVFCIAYNLKSYGEAQRDVTEVDDNPLHEADNVCA